MTDEVKIDVDRPQHSSPLIQNNNGNDRSHTSTGVEAQEKSIPITDLLKMVAKMLGVLVCGWVVLVLVQGGMVDAMETKDRGFVTMLFFLVCFRCWRHYCNQDQSFTEATQSLSVDYSSIPNNNQQLALPIRYIDRLFYCSRLVSSMTSVVLSVMRLASQDFGKKEVANKESRDFTLKVFYGLTLAEALVLLFAEALSFPTEALVLLFAEALSFPIRGNSVGLAVGPGDGLEVGLTRDGPEDRPADGPKNGPGGKPEDGSENGPVNQSNEYNAVAQMDQPANQSNDFNSEGPADSLPNLRQRRREIPQWRSQVKVTLPKWRSQVKVESTGGVEGRLDDGQSWRKYGQKDILGAKHPRSYYRCTYCHSQGCQATKQVQRTDDDPTVFDVIYKWTHTCIHYDPTLVVSALSNE